MPNLSPTTKPVAAAFCAVLVGIGLARFAYSPLLPAMIDAHWFGADDAAYLGAANLAGYLIGALGAHRMGRMFPTHWVLRLSMVAAVLSFFACMQPFSFAWFFPWRVLSGVIGGFLIVLAPPTALHLLPVKRRGIAAGIIFAGIGVGIVISGTVLPALLHVGLQQAWMGLGLISAVLTLVVWTWWHDPVAADADKTAPSAQVATTTSMPHLQDQPTPSPARDPAVIRVCLAYGLIAIALVPHMVFLVDFIARHLHQGIAIGGTYWVIFGIGAVLGPVCAGRLADRIGFGPALVITLLVQIPAIAIPSLTALPMALGISSFLTGAAVPGVVSLVLGRLHELIEHREMHKAAWGLATATFATGQAAAGYGYAYGLSISGEDYQVVFASGAVAMFLSLIMIATGRKTSPARKPCEIKS